MCCAMRDKVGVFFGSQLELRILEIVRNPLVVEFLVCGWETLGSSLAPHFNREYEYP